MFIEECPEYTLSLDPDVTQLGLGFPNEQDAARHFSPLRADHMEIIRLKTITCVEGKGRIWWNPSQPSRALLRKQKQVVGFSRAEMETMVVCPRGRDSSLDRRLRNHQDDPLRPRDGGQGGDFDRNTGLGLDAGHGT